MENLQDHLITLEDILVQEFRAYQTLHNLTKEERQFLSRGDASSLEPVVEKKEVVLDELNQLEDQRRMIVPKLAEIAGLQSQSTNLEPNPGVYNNVIVYGFQSLYPSIISTHNISSGALRCRCCNEVVPDEQMHFCTKITGLFPKPLRLIFFQISSSRYIL